MFALSTQLFAPLTADSISDSLADMADLEIYRIIGAAVAARRKTLRLKQAEVAEQIGLTRASLANIESGRQKIMLDQIYKLAAALKIDSITDLIPPSFSFEEAMGPLKLVGSEVNDQQKAQIEEFLRRTMRGKK
jgi:transcriptional regulator with XRE-family HTH domain